MTKPLSVHILMLLDRSGSMGRLAPDVIGGFNQFVAEQQATPGKCRLTVAQFDSLDPFEIAHDAVKIADVPHLTPATFIPRGSTPLLDAEARLIRHGITRADQRHTAGKPDEAVLVVTYTDGEENCSRETTFEQLTALKKEREEAGWAFLYLGVGHDAYAQAARIGTNSASTVSVEATRAGVLDSYASYTAATRNVRSAAERGERLASSDLFLTEDATSDA